MFTSAHRITLALAFTLCPALHAAPWKAIAVNAGNVAATVFDVESTQSCLHRNVCAEGNPVMPTDRLAAYGLTLGIGGVEGVISFGMHHKHAKLWWLFPTLNGASHVAAGTATIARFGW